MTPNPNDTIYALASGTPPAAIAIVRISGPRAFAVAADLAGELPAPRYAAVRRLRREDGETLDQALVLVFPGPGSATGDDIVELHLHGGRAVVDAVEGALAAAGLRRADPGEFTRRALKNGRIDLAQAEGLADLLEAETEGQRRVAIEAAEGAVSRAVAGWRERLVMFAARVEAQIDFADEDDVAADEMALASVRDDIAALADEIEAVLAQPPVERIRDGIRVVIAGPPNAGKSTLINALAGRPVAIATPIAGTTRDRIEAPVVRDGVAYVLTDTAGLTETDDPVEAIGVERAREAIVAGDILLWLGDEDPPAGAVRVWPRADLPGREQAAVDADVVVSARTGTGVAALWERVAVMATTLLPRSDRLSLNRRQREHAGSALADMRSALRSRDEVVLAEELRASRARMDELTGFAATNEMLDALFGRFCVGK